MHQPAVVAKLDNVVGIALLLGLHDGLKKRLLDLLPVHQEAPLEEPVPAVFAAGKQENRVEWKLRLAKLQVRNHDPNGLQTSDRTDLGVFLISNSKNMSFFFKKTH